MPESNREHGLISSAGRHCDVDHAVAEGREYAMLDSPTGWGDSLARLGIDRAQFVDTLNRLCFLRRQRVKLGPHGMAPLP